MLSLAHIPTTEGEAGRGELNNAATWDDFPNGRFGDFKSPAFGDQGPWGTPGISVRLSVFLPSGYISTTYNENLEQRNEALGQWGHPRTLNDLTGIFLDHLHSNIPTTPFSPTPLSPESLMILPHLERLTKRGWWTVGSQPAVDGVSSGDEVVGWGPRAGYVFQKGFVEFFCGIEEVQGIEQRVVERGRGWVHWFAGNSKVCRLRRCSDGKLTV
jgi:methylenetetrahydrofolate reductase (NADPH)